MKKLLSLTAIGIFLISCSVHAKWDSEEVQKVIKKQKKVKKIVVAEKYPVTQVVKILVPSGKGILLHYTIDLRAKMCFVGQKEHSEVSCKKLKKGYPIMKPLLKWVK